MAIAVAGFAFVPTAGPSLVAGVTVVAATLQTALMVIDLAIMGTALNQWRVLSDIYFGLCQGLFNMKFSNNWINGVLYHFRFMRKSRKVDDAGNDIAVPIDYYPDRVVWRQRENDKYTTIIIEVVHLP